VNLICMLKRDHPHPSSVHLLFIFINLQRGNYSIELYSCLTYSSHIHYSVSFSKLLVTMKLQYQNFDISNGTILNPKYFIIKRSCFYNTLDFISK